MLQDYDSIRQCDVGQAVGREEDSFALGKAPQALKKLMLRPRVQVGGGLVQNQCGVSAVKGPGQGKFLILSPGEFHPLPVKKPGQERIQPRRGLVQNVLRTTVNNGAGDSGIALRPLRVRDRNVLPKVKGITGIVLEVDAEALTQTTDGIIPDIQVVDLHHALIHIVETEKELNEGRLARPIQANQCHPFMLTHTEGHVPQNLFSCARVSKAYMVKLNGFYLFQHRGPRVHYAVLVLLQRLEVFDLQLIVIDLHHCAGKSIYPGP